MRDADGMEMAGHGAPDVGELIESGDGFSVGIFHLNPVGVRVICPICHALSRWKRKTSSGGVRNLSKELDSAH